MRQAAALSGQGLAWVTPQAMLVGLCASALVPIALAEPGLLAVAAGLNVVGSVGANVLASLIGESLNAARVHTHSGDSSAESADHVARVERELATRLEEVLLGDDARAEALAEALAAVLNAVDATGAMIGEALASGQARLLEEMVARFAVLGQQSAGLAPMLERLDAAAGRIQQTLCRQDAERRQDRAEIQQQSVLLLVMRDQFSEQMRDLERSLAGVTGWPAQPDAGAGDGARWSGGCPYQGLAPFGSAAAGVFYGRGQATARLVAMVTIQRDGGGLIVVTGASGAGKSSLLHAGLLPALACDGDLAAAALIGGGEVEVRPSLGGEPAGLVVTAVRADFADRCAVHPALARAIEERVFWLGPMSGAELQRAITGPAAAAGLVVEDGLAEQVMRELAGHLHMPAGAEQDQGAAVGALPLLSMAMVRTWDNRRGRWLSRQGYDRSGGVASAVNDAAEDVYN